MQQVITILGSTGSIGCNTLRVLALHQDKYRVFALTGHANAELMLQQCMQFQPEVVVMTAAEAAQQLEKLLQQAQLAIPVLTAVADLELVASHTKVTTVMAAIVGAAGLAPALAAAHAGKRLLLANKEAIVVGGRFFQQAIVAGGATLLPIDSEHSAIFQSLPAERALWSEQIDKLLLTGSGGPFRQLPLAEFAAITPEQACSHPNFKMGRKISVDSATMVNKALEVIEAKYLFAVDLPQLEVIIHPQQVIHSMVQYKDASVVAQLGASDMRIPISYGLAWPQRIDSGVTPLNFTELSELTFLALDPKRYPAFDLVWQVLQAKDGTTIVYNASNEVAVDAFLRRQIKFIDIAAVISNVLAKMQFDSPQSCADIWQIDAQARRLAEQMLPH